ncbi:DUF761 domain-containing protein [Cephalotus follicularis]|uniref:DUF761 domain-containing protein n=1 Tax=Cephalotus follicularis TaxID=3775 RepID=A0A1Q3DHX8_CEPFO|nr:DUF761 domain-containing protein [Cephalotus follicularis]
MEKETKQPVRYKKLWKIVRVLFFMLKASISESKLMVDLQMMIKRSNKVAGKAIYNFIFHHQHSSFTSCRSDDALNFISPKDYEFSCSNSPAFQSFYAHKRKHHHNVRHFEKSFRYDDVTTVAAVQKMLEMLNNEVVEASPLVLPGFGRSPIARQLRITDSPFPLKDEGDSQVVDKAAEEFIKNFYKDLKLQKTKAALESPYHGMWGR